MKFFLINLSLSLCFVSCVQHGPTYTEPQPSKNTCVIKESSVNGGFMTSSYFGVSKVNNVPVKPKNKFSKNGSDTFLPAGKHKLTVILFHTSPQYKNGALRAEAEVTSSLVAGHTYQANGCVHNSNFVELWIQDQTTGKLASNKKTINPEAIAPIVPIITPIN